MTFADYVNVLKKHFKQSISNNELCGILFDAIITPLNLKNRNGKDFILDKAEVSRIMNGKKKIPTALQDHVWDKPVLDGLEEYFETNIVAELNSNTSDLCHQLMNLIEEDENISPTHKATLRLSANPRMIALFLAEAFIYVVNQYSNSATFNFSTNTAVSKPILKIRGITATNELSENVELIRFHPRYEFSVDEYEHHIRQLYEEISNFKLEDEYCSKFEKIYRRNQQIIERMNYLSTSVKINERDQSIIKNFAEEIRFILPEDFFHLGNLRRDVSQLTFKPVNFYGDVRGQIKYDKIESLLKNIKNYHELKPIDEAFSYVLCIRLALCNIGQTFDENINVRLIIDKDSLLTSNYLEDYILRDIIDKFDDIFIIKRDKNFFEYDNPKTSISDLQPIMLFGNDRNLVEEWNELFPYFVSTDDNFIILELDFEKILQNTAISFPTVILLKKCISSMEYEIRSKFTPKILHGTISVKDTSPKSLNDF